jgi:hypothetical protein
MILELTVANMHSHAFNYWPKDACVAYSIAAEEEV